MKKILIVLLLMTGSALADHDVRFQSETEVSHQITDKLTLSAEGHLRFDEDISRLAAVMPEFNAKYKLNKYTQFVATYRYAYKNRSEGWKAADRFNGDMKIKYKALPLLTTAYQFRYQERFLGADRTTTVRNKGTVTTKLGVTKPFAALEIFHNMNDGADLERIRLDLGTSWGIYKFFYRTEFALAAGKTTPHIIGFKQGF